MFLLHKGICTFNATSIKIPVAFTELEKTILKFTQNHKILLIVKAILRKNKAGDITIPDVKVYYKAIVVKYYGTGIKKRHISVEKNQVARNKPLHTWSTST